MTTIQVRRDTSHVGGTRSLKNLLVLLATQLISWGLAVAVAKYLPAYLGAANLGKLGLAYSIIAVTGTLVPLGTSAYLTKEIARDPDKTRVLVANAIALRIGLTILLSCLVALGAQFVGIPDLTRTLILIGCASLLAGTINEAFSAALQGHQNFVRHSLVTLTDKFFLSGATLAVIFLHGSVASIAAVAVFAPLLALAVNIAGYRTLVPRQTSQTQEPPAITRASMRALILSGLPYLGSAVQVLYVQTDPIILAIFTSDEVVGWYAAAFRLVGSTLFFPSAVTAVLGPRLSIASVRGDGEFARLTRRMLFLVTLLAVPIGLVFICIPEVLVALLDYGTSFDAILPVMRFAGVGVLLWFVAIAVGTSVIASDGQARLFRASLLALGVGIPLCIVCVIVGHRVWGNGAAGAMASDVVLEGILLVCYLRALPPGTLNRNDGFLLARVWGAGIPMALVLITCARYVGLWGLLPALVTYLGVCILFRVFDAEDWQRVRDLWSRVQSQGR